MNIQDREKSLTAEELRRRYNLDGLDNDRKSIQLIRNSINKVEIEFQNYMDIVNKSLGEYQDQVEITTWFSNDYPTFDTPEDHFGDLYYDKENGKAYRFNKTRNLLDKTLIDDSYRNVNNTTQLDTGLKVTCTESGIQRWTCVPIPNSDNLLGETLTLSTNVVRSGSNQAKMVLYYINTNNKTIISAFGQNETSSNGQLKVTCTPASSYPAGANAIGILLYSTSTTTAQVGDYVEYNNLQLEIGESVSTYESYYSMWEEIEIDKQVETLAIENSKADTSDDKRIVFVETPTTPYTIGDVLIKNGTYYRCRAARESGDYSMTDWVIYTDYTDDMVMLDTRGEIDRLQTNVETNYVSTTQLETNTQGIYATVSATYATQTTVSTLDGEVQSSKEDIRQIDSRLSVEEGKITTLISDVGNRTGKTTSLTQDVDEIRAEISDIADITKSAERYEAYIPDTEFQDIAASNPINITIHPVGENISYLYPNTGLFPSSTTYLKVRTLRFTNTSTNENFDYILPEDLLYYDANVYDTLTIDYENARIRVLKKCTYNADGTVSTITPEEHDYDNTFSDFEQNLSLTQGDYEVSILGYSVGYIYVRLMALNAYTAQYATKVELHSSITQTATSINLEVAKKITGFDGNGNRTDDVISSINLAPGTATITADKVNIQGVLTAINNDTTTTIDGDKITTGSITTDQLSSNSVNASKIVAGTITADKIANATITGSKLVNGTITGTQIADSTINNSKIANGTIENAKIKNGTIEGTKIKDATITSAKISSIDASKITTGTLTSREINNGNGTFKVTSNGVLTASSGTIGGWTIGTNRLESGSGSNYVRLDSNSGVNSAFWCGDEDASAAPFRVTKAGRLTATDANITGEITATSGSFAGTLNGATGTFRGSMTAGSLNINNRFIVDSNGSFSAKTSGGGYISMGVFTNNPFASGLNIGSSGLNISNGDGSGKILLSADANYGYIRSMKGLSYIFPLDKNGNTIPGVSGGAMSLYDVFAVVKYCKDKGYYMNL